MQGWLHPSSMPPFCPLEWADLAEVSSQSPQKGKNPIPPDLSTWFHLFHPQQPSPPLPSLPLLFPSIIPFLLTALLSLDDTGIVRESQELLLLHSRQKQWCLWVGFPQAAVWEHCGVWGSRTTAAGIGRGQPQWWLGSPQPTLASRQAESPCRN